MQKEVKINTLAYGGDGIGRIDDKVVFVPFTAPGDVVEIEVVEEKKRFSRGRVANIIEASPLRIDAPCPHFTRCGGCQWQHIDYTAQLEWKGRIMKETLERIGGVKEGGHLKFHDPLPSPNEFGYRSRARFHVKGREWGFFAAASHRIVDMESCPILRPAVNESFKRIREALTSSVPKGLHSVEIGTDVKYGGEAAAFYISKETNFDWKGALKGVEGLKGFEVYVEREGRGESRGGKTKKIISEGSTRLYNTVRGLAIGADIASFSQVNPEQNEKLVGRVLAAASLTSTECVWDLYAGSGNIAVAIASEAASVVAVESDRASAGCGRDNAMINEVGNVKFHQGTVLEMAKTIEKSKPHVVILDPPRGGGADVMGVVARSGARRVVYVSCDPPTLARDISFLAEKGYAPFSSLILDMFPQTYHMEAVVGLALS